MVRQAPKEEIIATYHLVLLPFSEIGNQRVEISLVDGNLATQRVDSLLPAQVAPQVGAACRPISTLALIRLLPGMFPLMDWQGGQICYLKVRDEEDSLCLFWLVVNILLQSL